MKRDFRIVRDTETFKSLTQDVGVLVVADVENKPGPASFELLTEVVLVWANAPQAVVVAFHEWNAVAGTLERVCDDGLRAAVGDFVSRRGLIGHGIEHDREWLNAALEIETKWHADTRTMWHLSDWHQVQRGYGLKDAQKLILGWAESNDVELEHSIKAAGGSLKKGDHYLAPSWVRAKYAALDGWATLELYENRKGFFDEHNYWQFLNTIQNYGAFLQEATRRGVACDAALMAESKAELEKRVAELEENIRIVCQKEIQELELKWATKYTKKLKTSKGKHNYLTAPQRWIRFNANSTHHRNALFHDTLKFPVLETTETGKPKSDRSTIEAINHPAAEAFVAHSEEADTLEKVSSYLTFIKDGKIHFPLNWCATVSGRLGGFKPYALNLPFDSELAMRPFSVRPGMLGIHADLKSIEPCMIGGMSGDETLLKVHRDGLGDVYLDLFLDIVDGIREHLPTSLLNEFLAEYDPYAVCTDATKEKFKLFRKPVKIIHLAKGYTGTEHTIARTLNKNGFPVDLEVARWMSNKYDAKFWAVKELEEKLKAIHKRDGFVRNVWGRVIHVPEGFKKDTLNRWAQSGAHDTLVMWVNEIILKKLTRRVNMDAVLPDCHDSTSWETVEREWDDAKAVFEDALSDVNNLLNLPVRAQCEIKAFRTFYGLKNRE